MAEPRVLVLRAPGTNRDLDAQEAWQRAGARAEIVHVNQLLSGERRLRNYQVLTLPGGFSYGDHLGAGSVLARNLMSQLGEQFREFVAHGGFVLGICNGFQALARARVFGRCTLYTNESGHFECSWVRLAPVPESRCLWTQGLAGEIEAPIAHGEGRFLTPDAATQRAFWDEGRVALRYVGRNPNGSQDAIAGVCDLTGRVLGLMPHPENHIRPQQHPEWPRGRPPRHLGLALFQNAVRVMGGGVGGSPTGPSAP